MRLSEARRADYDKKCFDCVKNMVVGLAYPVTRSVTLNSAVKCINMREISTGKHGGQKNLYVVVGTMVKSRYGPHFVPVYIYVITQ